jgi:hypothetical protein
MGRTSISGLTSVGSSDLDLLDTSLQPISSTPLRQITTACLPATFTYLMPFTFPQSSENTERRQADSSLWLFPLYLPPTTPLRLYLPKPPSFCLVIPNVLFLSSPWSSSSALSSQLRVVTTFSESPLFISKSCPSHSTLCQHLVWTLDLRIDLLSFIPPPFLSQRISCFTTLHQLLTSIRP